MAKIIPFPQQPDDMFSASANSALRAGLACAEILIFTGSRRKKPVVLRRSPRRIQGSADFSASAKNATPLKLVGA